MSDDINPYAAPQPLDERDEKPLSAVDARYRNAGAEWLVGVALLGFLMNASAGILLLATGLIAVLVSLASPTGDAALKWLTWEIAPVILFAGLSSGVQWTVFRGAEDLAQGRSTARGWGALVLAFLPLTILWPLGVLASIVAAGIHLARRPASKGE